MNDGSNNAVRRKEMPFWGLVSWVEKSIADVPRPLVTETPAGRNVEHHNNSLTVADKRVQHEDKKEPSWLGLSNSDTISGEWRHLLMTSASGPFCENKILFNLLSATLDSNNWVMTQQVYAEHGAMACTLIGTIKY
jgi:hypothetical protein